MTRRPSMRLIRESSLVRRPWKNGGGTTVEIAAAPDGAGLDTFDWRVSMADVATDGPFSTFPGVDRTLVLLRGAGLDLTIDGTEHRLSPESPTVSFPGDVPTTATLVAGPIRDLNVMTRRGRYAHEMAFVQAERVGVTVGVLFAQAGPLIVAAGERGYQLGALDALLIEESAMLDVDGPALLVRLQAVAERG